MAYSFTITEGDKIERGDAVLQTFRIEETDVAPTDEWSMPVADIFAVELWKAENQAASAAATLTPELGTVSGWTSGGAGHIGKAAAADANHRIISSELSTIDTGGGSVLYGRSNPDIDTSGAGGPHVITWLTISRF